MCEREHFSFTFHRQWPDLLRCHWFSSWHLLVITWPSERAKKIAAAINWHWLSVCLLSLHFQLASCSTLSAWIYLDEKSKKHQEKRHEHLNCHEHCQWWLVSLASRWNNNHTQLDTRLQSTKRFGQLWIQGTHEDSETTMKWNDRVKTKGWKYVLMMKIEKTRERNEKKYRSSEINFF